MMLPQVRQWQLDRLHEWASELENVVHSHAGLINRTAGAFADLDQFWVSRSADAVVDWMRAEKGSGARLASKVGAFAATLRTGAVRVARARGRLLGVVAETEAEGCFGIGDEAVRYSVDPDWRVRTHHTEVHSVPAHVLERIELDVHCRQVRVNDAYTAFAKELDALTQVLTVLATAITPPPQTPSHPVTGAPDS
ncbi:hypothetical protein [Nocardia sp. NPDC003183]